jgi:hypothetical protein
VARDDLHGVDAILCERFGLSYRDGNIPAAAVRLM